MSLCKGYELTADIDLSGYENWLPIGGCTKANECPGAFKSIFDGNKRTISNLVINANSGTHGVGLFGAISPASTLQNINIQDATVTGGSSDIGVLAGFLREATIINSSLSQGEVNTGGSYVGGLVGDARSATIISSSAIDVTVRGEGFYIGGLVGDARIGGNITNSYVINVTVRGGETIGGLVGDMRNGDIIKSYTTNTNVDGFGSAGSLTGNIAGGNVIHSYANNFYVKGNNNVGGLIGDGSASTITSSYATDGAVIGGTGSHTGGLVGYARSGKVFTSYAKDINITGKSSGYVGGLIGGSGDIVASYTINTALVGANSRGGLVGFGVDYTGTIYKIDYSYAAPAPLQPAPTVGGLVGNTFGSKYLVTDSYWDNQTSGITNRTDVLDMHEGEGRNTTDLQAPTDFPDSIYANWANLWCDPDTGEFTSDSSSELAIRLREGGDEDALIPYRVWDLGFDDEYPVLTCGP